MFEFRTVVSEKNRYSTNNRVYHVDSTEHLEIIFKFLEVLKNGFEVQRIISKLDDSVY